MDCPFQPFLRFYCGCVGIWQRGVRGVVSTLLEILHFCWHISGDGVVECLWFQPFLRFYEYLFITANIRSFFTAFQPFLRFYRLRL